MIFGDRAMKKKIFFPSNASKISFLLIYGTREGYKSGGESEVGPIFTSDRRKKSVSKGATLDFTSDL